MKAKNQKSAKQNSSTKITEKEKSEESRLNYPHELEQPQAGSDISYSEEHDVTPPTPHEFPTFGNTATDFTSAGKHGRKTSRMIDHEPGL